MPTQFDSDGRRTLSESELMAFIAESDKRHPTPMPTAEDARQLERALNYQTDLFHLQMEQIAKGQPVSWK